eukprot:scaffold172381_cov46-Prasinocladus_malaysianus.AAC.1
MCGQSAYRDVTWCVWVALEMLPSSIMALVNDAHLISQVPPLDQSDLNTTAYANCCQAENNRNYLAIVTTTKQ